MSNPERIKDTTPLTKEDLRVWKSEVRDLQDIISSEVLMIRDCLKKNSIDKGKILSCLGVIDNVIN